MYEHGNIEHEEAALDSACFKWEDGSTCTLACMILGTRETQVLQRKHEREAKCLKSLVFFLIMDYNQLQSLKVITL